MWRPLSIPAIIHIEQLNTHRLIPSRYSEGEESVFRRRGILDLDRATNGRLPVIGTDELLSDVPFHDIINNAFLYPHPCGSRFNGSNRGAWYAGFELKTSQYEVTYHKLKQFAEIKWEKEEIATYDDYLADFSGNYYDIREDARYRDCLDPDSYRKSQMLAENLLRENASGIIYPSVRHNDGSVSHASDPRSSATFARASAIVSSGGDTISSGRDRPSQRSIALHRLSGLRGGCVCSGKLPRCQRGSSRRIRELIP